MSALSDTHNCPLSASKAKQATSLSFNAEPGSEFSVEKVPGGFEVT